MNQFSLQAAAIAIIFVLDTWRKLPAGVCKTQDKCLYFYFFMWVLKLQIVKRPSVISAARRYRGIMIHVQLWSVYQISDKI